MPVSLRLQPALHNPTHPSAHRLRLAACKKHSYYTEIRVYWGSLRAFTAGIEAMSLRFSLDQDAIENERQKRENRKNVSQVPCRSFISPGLRVRNRCRPRSFRTLRRFKAGGKTEASVRGVSQSGVQRRLTAQSIRAGRKQAWQGRALRLHGAGASRSGAFRPRSRGRRRTAPVFHSGALPAYSAAQGLREPRGELNFRGARLKTRTGVIPARFIYSTVVHNPLAE